MAILVDANQIAISHLMVRHKIENGIHIESVRKSIVRVLGRIQRRFKDEFGQMILCYDDKNYWRRESFPFYKQNRKKERENSKYDWDQVFSVLNKVRDELRLNFPYQVIQVHGAEADDVIATLVRSNVENPPAEPVLILSADKDFIQLHKYPLVKQYDPIRNRWIEDPDPVRYLQEHIIKGDHTIFSSVYLPVFIIDLWVWVLFKEFFEVVFMSVSEFIVLVSYEPTSNQSYE